jgi:hypothetical protein
MNVRVDILRVYNAPAFVTLLTQPFPGGITEDCEQGKWVSILCCIAVAIFAMLRLGVLDVKETPAFVCWWPHLPWIPPCELVAGRTQHIIDQISAHHHESHLSSLVTRNRIENISPAVAAY